MFEHLKELSPTLNQRYATIINNIKSGSNTFYDALGNLIDNYLKTIAKRENITIEVEFSSGRILKETGIKPFLLEKVRVTATEYEKLRATIRTINQHSHGNEKSVMLDHVKTNLENLFNVYIKVAKYYNPVVSEIFDSRELDTIFKSNVVLMKELGLTINSLKEELTKEKNISLRQNEILKNIKIDTKIEIAEEEQVNELTMILNELKDIKIELLNKKLDDALDLLIEQKTSIRENRIISLATLDRIVSFDDRRFGYSVARAIEVIDGVGFDSLIKTLRDDSEKSRQDNSDNGNPEK